MPVADKHKSRDEKIKAEYAEINAKERGCGNYDPLSIDIEGCNMLKAFIYSEIFGKPKSKRRGRWR